MSSSSAGTWKWAAHHMIATARREAHASALAVTGDEVHALAHAHRTGVQTRERLSAWADQQTPVDLQAAADRFFNAHPVLRPRTDAEFEAQHRAAEDRMLEQCTEVVPGETMEIVRNGHHLEVPCRRWYAR